MLPTTTIFLRHSLTGGLLLAALAFACVSPVAASDLTLQAVGTETATTSSNPLLSVNSVRPLTGSTTSPELILKDTTPTSSFGLDERMDENVFNQASFNSTDAHSTATVATKSQLWNATLQQQTDYDTTRTSELTNFNLTPGVVRHLGVAVAPQIAYTPTASDIVALAGSFAESRYDSTVFTNYNTYSASPSYTHSLDTRNSVIVTLQAQRYETARDNSIRIDSVGPQVGWQTAFSPRFTANAAIGAQTSRQYSFGTATDPWTWQYTFSGGVAFKGLQDTVNFTTARQQFPYGNGTEALQTNVTLTESHAVNSRISLNLGVNYLTSTYQSTVLGNLDQQAGASLGATYHATEQLDLTGSYQYRYETLVEISKTPQDNAFMLQLAYHPKLWTLLR